MEDNRSIYNSKFGDQTELSERERRLQSMLQPTIRREQKRNSNLSEDEQLRYGYSIKPDFTFE